MLLQRGALVHDRLGVEAVARQADEQWVANGRPRSVEVVERGGRRDLAEAEERCRTDPIDETVADDADRLTIHHGGHADAVGVRDVEPVQHHQEAVAVHTPPDRLVVVLHVLVQMLDELLHAARDLEALVHPLPIVQRQDGGR